MSYSFYLHIYPSTDSDDRDPECKLRNHHNVECDVHYIDKFDIHRNMMCHINFYLYEIYFCHVFAHHFQNHRLFYFQLNRIHNKHYL